MGVHGWRRRWVMRAEGLGQQIRVPIRLKVLGVLVLLATAASLVVSSTLIRLFNDDKRTYIQDLNADMAANMASTLSMLLDMYAERLSRVALEFNQASEPAATLAEFLERNPDLVYLGIYDTERRNVLDVARAGAVEQAGHSLEEFRARRARLEKSPHYLELRGPVVRNGSESQQLLLLTMLVPLRTPGYGTVAVRADFLATRLLQAIQARPGFSSYVVDPTGTVLAHADPAVMASHRSFAERGVVRALLDGLGVSAGGSGEFVEPDGEPVLASYSIVRTPSLGVIVQRARRDAYSAAERLVGRSMNAALLIIVLSILASILISRALTAPVLRLIAAARRLERGDFDAHVEPGSADELGELARSFNLAAQGLKERDFRLKETYEQLLQSEKLAGFGKFSAGIAHEIKNPLTGIIGFAQMIARKLPEGDPRHHPMQMIEKEAKRCKTILDNLLKFTRKEGLLLEPLRINRHIEETVELLAPQLNLSQVRTELDLQAPDDLIQGDGNQLRQVLMNLLLNAVDAMEATGDRRITIATRAGAEGYLEVLVGDTGPGIPQDKIRRVFDPFFTTKEPGKGTGLGLSVSYGIVSHHGGRISVRNLPGAGAEFKLVLPLGGAEARVKEAARAPAGAASAANGGPERGSQVEAAGSRCA